MILEDDEMNTPSIEAAAMLASADVGIESSLELKKPTSHVNQEAWYDIEYGCYVLEDCTPSREYSVKHGYNQITTNRSSLCTSNSTTLGASLLQQRRGEELSPS